jgi:hypothetical protein
MDAAVCVPLGADPTTGATVCPRAGIAAAAANVTEKRKSCGRALMIFSPFIFSPFAVRPPAYDAGIEIFYFKNYAAAHLAGRYRYT